MVREIGARIEEAVGVARTREPVTHGCPFPEGQLLDPERVRLLADGAPLPLQTGVLARWPDGSVKWLLLDAQIDLRPRQVVDLRVEYGPQVEPLPVRGPLRADRVAGGLEIDTGALRLRLSDHGTHLFEAAGEGLAQDGPPQLSMRDADGAAYAGQVESLTVEETNGLRLVVRAEGRYVADDGAPGLSWIVRVTCHAHQPWVKLHHTFVHDLDSPLLLPLQEMQLAWPLALSSAPRVMLGSPERTTHYGEDHGRQSEPVWMWEREPGRHSVLGLPGGRIDRSVPSHGWLYAGDDECGVQVKLRNPSQNYPKVYAASRSSIAVHLYPDPTGWTQPEERGRRYTEIDFSSDGDYRAALPIPQGMAKTHELFLGIGGPARDLVEVASRAAAWQHPLLLEIDSRAYADSGALHMLPRYYDEYWRLEEILRAGTTGGGTPLTGMVSFGDTGIRSTGEQQVTRTTDNVAYDRTQTVLRQYMRRGDQPLMWLGEAMALHLMDVDTYHHCSATPDYVGGPHDQWSQFHHYTTTARTELSRPNRAHTWFGGLLDYYYLTGYRRALEVARLTGRFCARSPTRRYDISPAIRDRWNDPRQAWDYWTREAGWALTGTANLYELDPDDELRSAMTELVDVLERWQDADGRWRHPIGSFNRGAVPFMASGILTGLMRVWELTGDERARRMCLQGCRQVATTVTREGLVYYKEAPISRSGPHASAVLNFRPLAFAYSQTHERAILQTLWRMFRWRLEMSGGPQGYEVKDVLCALPTLEQAGLLELWRNEELP